MALRDLIEPRELLYPSNLLTISRLLLLPATIYYMQRTDRRERAVLLLAITMITDALDGPIARRRGEVSKLGQILDPIADKALIDSAAVMLSRTRGFPWWATGLLIFRDVGILLAGLIVLRRKAQITTAESSGKLTTLAMTIVALLYLAGGPRWGKPALYAALVPFSISFVQYGWRFIQIMRDEPDTSGRKDAL
ncbi:CDP-alcohol phosphatidyltransferase family protein [Chloroflexus sp.]|uniref:CDP-alcohol phosphatidyltransferase family protein n=1 Tax=Chloroflexus sp. TaxID=1904827 RepID=UPI00298F3BEF|nr:CDP-alcohol phosphatidyltransferase family protein [Chloroflexus sp.]MCS6889496.1 CDP-alcohol phosphatidyltransferase family protein [Chloroflexus sp.]MCX7859891.1 CDP-alcohol phosphatidyltransferase family protein [Chloroflexus sp.]MDW8405838.1 CDP-alcohol phosphatidyltransferase family protein [Chloroflexus sp.]